MRIVVNGVEILFDDGLRGVNHKLDRILTQQSAILALEKVEMATVKNVQDSIVELQATVEAEVGQEQSIIKLLNEMSALEKQIAADLAKALADNDPVALQAAVDAINQLAVSSSTQAAAIAAAVAANPLPTAP